MNLKYKNTKIQCLMKPTEDHLGLPDNDYWVHLYLTIENEEEKIAIDKKMISIIELQELYSVIKEQLNREVFLEKRISFIKNFLHFHFTKNNSLIIKLYSYEKTSEFNTLVFEREEVQELYQKIKVFKQKNHE